MITFDVDQFRLQFPAFANPDDYPDAVLQNDFDQSTCIISAQNYGWLAGDCRVLALYLCTAHIAYLATQVSHGQTPELISNATIDKITVGRVAPPLKNQWQWWLCTSPYGMQLFAMLQARSVGGFYVGGLPERSAIRKVYGTFAS